MPASADDAERIGKLEKENQVLLKRLDALEGMAKKEIILASGDGPKTMVVKALSSINISSPRASRTRISKRFTRRSAILIIRPLSLP